MINQYFPIYFFFVLFLNPKEYSVLIPILLGLTLDRLIYSLPFLHTIFFLLSYLLSLYIKPRSTRCKDMFWMFLLWTLYNLFIVCFTENFSFLFYLIQLLYLIIFTNILYFPKRIHMKRK